MRVLVVEDEPQIAREISEALTRSGYVAEVVRDGETASFRAETEPYDAMVLDLGLPKLDGLSVLRRLRRVGIGLPTVILTARGAWLERVEGIDAGADDYVTKPFYNEELVARLGAVLRRSGGHASPMLEAGPIQLDTRRLSVTVDGRPIELTSLEFRLLRYLVHHKGRTFSQMELEEHVYAGEREPDSNAMEALVHRLRRKIGSNLIVTKRGQGYMIEDTA